LIGTQVAHYRVLELIGAGGMGIVYKAEDLKLARRVALKFLPEELANEPLDLKRFEREARTASALNHPNICTIYQIDEDEGRPFIAMELHEGDSLLHRLASSEMRATPLDSLLDIAIQICTGLQAAHDHGIIHRDIKPGNLFLTGRGRVKILDFGLAKAIASAELVAETCRERTRRTPQTRTNVRIKKGHRFRRRRMQFCPARNCPWGQPDTCPLSNS
jgi:serine/threonine protein kinase